VTWIPPSPNRAPWGTNGSDVEGLEPLNGDTSAGVAVVGAGITGLTTAFELAEAGVDVVVLEAAELGAGATGFTTAKVSVLQSTQHRKVAERWGDEVTAAFATANQTGFDWILDRIAAEEIACDLERRPAATYATTSKGKAEVEGEVEAANRAGVSVRLERDLDVPFPVEAVAVLDDQAQFDPLAYLRGLARAVLDRGGRLHTGTRAVGLRDGRELVTDHGLVRADHVLVCTGTPFRDRSFAFGRLEPTRSYCIGVRAGGDLPRTMSISADQPTRSLRTAVAPDGVGELLVVGGNSHVVGREPDTRSRYEDLADWAVEHFDVQAVDWRWSTQDYVPLDELPLIGRSWGLPDHVRLASGYAKWGMTKGTAAGIALAAGVTDEPPAWAEPFDPRRPDPLRAPVKFAELNGSVGWRLVRDRLRTLRRRVPDLADGDGAVVHSGIVGRTAVSQVDGRRCAVSGVCPHLGGTLAWNPAEQSWDCPLHGSRFDREGHLRQGPAVEDLEPRDLPG
jgi:glycine/D-amino acid oxidase-like deaminating enzyme/nitrite reductase/ring-hydroxylating ferredoxin subunit